MGSFDKADQFIQDWQTEHASKPASRQTVIVGLDRQSLAAYGGHPVDRRHVAEVLEALEEAGVRRVLLDLTLSQPKREEDDSALESALQRLGRQTHALPNSTDGRFNRRSGSSDASFLEPI